MKRKIWQIGLLAVLILALASPVALAQDTSGDRLVIGQSFVLPAGEELTGNLAVLGGSATLQEGSVVRGDVAVLGGSLTIAGTVEGNVALFGGAVVLQESAVVGGNVGAFGGTIQRDPSAVVSGDVFSGVPAPFPLPLPGIPGDIPTPAKPWPPAVPLRDKGSGGVLGVLGSIVIWQLVTFGWVLGLALLGAIAISVAPKAMGRIASQAASDMFVSFGMGLLTLVVGLLLGLLLLIACCIGLLGWLALGIAWLVGWLAVGLWLGQRLLQALNVRNASSIGEVAVGVAVITILSRLPWCIGFLFGLVVGCIGLGAVVMTRFGTQPPNGRAPRAAISPDAGDSSLLLPVVSPAIEPAPEVAVTSGVETTPSVEAPGFVPEALDQTAEPEDTRPTA